VILVHNTFTKQEDIDYINEVKSAEQLLSFCICPSANIYIENTFPPVFMLLENEANVVIGTDSLASNHQLDILEELKLISGKWPKIKTDILLKWATLNGAKALQMDDTLGSFKKGMQPSIVLIENIQGDRFIESSKARKIL
jgi:cytosine/adenosine deaminase-related metal-dependent hydrolase